MFFVLFVIVRVDAYVDMFCRCDRFRWVDILFLIIRLAQWPSPGKMAIHMAAADDVLDGDYSCVVLSH